MFVKTAFAVDDPQLFLFPQLRLPNIASFDLNSGRTCFPGPFLYPMIPSGGYHTEGPQPIVTKMSNQPLGNIPPMKIQYPL